MNATLFDIPQTHRPKLEVWKERFGVRTEHYEGLEMPWCCVQPELIEQRMGCYGARKDMSIAEMGAYVGRLIDEGGYEGEGVSEQAACLDLATKRKLPFLESITEADCRIQPEGGV